MPGIVKNTQVTEETLTHPVATSRTLLSLMSYEVVFADAVTLGIGTVGPPGRNLQLSPYLEDHRKISSSFLINCFVCLFMHMSFCLCIVQEASLLVISKKEQTLIVLTLLPTD